MKRLWEFIRRYWLDVFTMKMSVSIISVILLISGVLLCISYLFFMNNISVQAEKSSVLRLREIVNMVENNLSYADGIATSLAVSREARNLSAIEYLDDVDRIEAVRSMSEQLRLQKFSNSLIHSLYLYYPDAGVVVYDALYQASDVDDVENISFQEEDPVFCTPHARFSHYTDAGYQDLLKIVKPLAYESGYVVVNLSAAELSGYLEGLKISNEELIWLSDKNGNVVLEDRVMPADLQIGHTTWQGKDYIVVEQTGEFTKWRFRLAIPFESFCWNYGSIQLFIPIFSLVLLFGSVVSGLFITLRISRPVNRLYYSVTENQEIKQDHFKYLLSSYEKLWPMSLKLQEEMGFLNLLLRAPSENGAKVSNFQKLLPYCEFRVLAIDLSVSKVTGGEFFQIMPCFQLIRDAFSGMGKVLKFRIVQVEPHRLAVIVNFDPSVLTVDEMVPMFSDLVVSIHEEVGVSVNVGVSDPKQSITDLYVAFQEALKALEYRFLTGSNALILFSDIGLPHFSLVSYPSGLEQELLDHLRMGNRTKTQEIFKEIQEFTEKVEGVHPAFSRMVAASMMSAVRQLAFRLMPESQAEMACERALKHQENLWGSTEELCEEILVFIQNMKKNKNETVAQRILSYIQEHFAEELTVESISRVFGISTSYCYRILQEQKQISPMRYISQVRVDQAAQRLKNSQDPVKKIAVDCGFESLQIFYRQFKNIKGVSPSNYRRTSRSEKE